MVFSIAMDWRQVLFANWPVEPAIVRDHLPDQMTPDTFEGQAWLSVVPFINIAVRPQFLPRHLGFALPELNLRTYVTVDGTPGVYFFSLDADGLLGVIGGRFFHHLPYFLATIDMQCESDGAKFNSNRRHPGARPLAFSASYRSTNDAVKAPTGSLAHFLTERYRYYTETTRGELRHANVSHRPWPLFEVEVEIDADEIFTANGFTTPTSDPFYLYSPGVETVASKNIETLQNNRPIRGDM